MLVFYREKCKMRPEVKSEDTGGRYGYGRKRSGALHEGIKNPEAGTENQCTAFQKRKGTDLAGASEKNDVTGAV